jgi:DNA polymerase-3 subunit alpha
MLEALDDAIKLGQIAAEDRKTGQMSFFADGSGQGADRPSVQFPSVEPLSEARLLAAEKETLGFYISSHPLVHYGRELDSLSLPKGVNLAQIEHCPDGTAVTIGCMIASVRSIFTKKNEKMAMLTLEDLTGKCDAVVFPRSYQAMGEMLSPETIVFIVGAVDRSRERANIIVDRVIPIDQAVEDLTSQIKLRLEGSCATGEFFHQLEALLGRHRGDCPVLLELTPPGHADVRLAVRLDKKWSVRPSRKLLKDLEELLNLAQDKFVLIPKANGSGNGSAPQRRPYRRPAAQPAGQGDSLTRAF